MSLLLEILEKYPELQNYPHEELIKIIKVFSFFYDKVKEVADRKNEIIESEFENLLNILSPHQHVKLGEKQNIAKVRMRVLNTVMLNENEYNVYTNRKHHIFLPSDFRMDRSLTYKKGLSVSSPSALYKLRTVRLDFVSNTNSRARFRIQSNTPNYVDWKVWLREALTQEPITIKIKSGQTTSEYFFTSFTVNDDDIIVDDVYGIDNVPSGSQIEGNFLTPMSLEELTEENIEIAYDVDRFSLDASVILRDKDEVVRVAGTEEIKDLYNLRVRDKNGTYNLMLVEDREFLNNVEFVKSVTQVTGRETIPVGVVVEDGGIFLVFPSWVAKEYGRSEVEIDVEVVASRIRGGGFMQEESITNREDVIFTIYQTDPTTSNVITNVSRKSLTAEFYANESITFLNNSITTIERPRRLETKTLITTDDILNIINKDFEIVKHLQHRLYIDELSTFSDPTNFYALVHNKKTTLKLKNSYELQSITTLRTEGEVNNIQNTLTNALGGLNDSVIIMAFSEYAFGNIKESPPMLPIIRIKRELETKEVYKVDNALYFLFKDQVPIGTRNALRELLISQDRIRREVQVFLVKEASPSVRQLMAFPITALELESGQNPKTITIRTKLPVYGEREREIRNLIRKMDGIVKGVIVGTQNNSTRIAHLTTEIEMMIDTDPADQRRKLFTTFTYRNPDSTYLITLYNNIDFFINANQQQTPSVLVEVGTDTDFYEDVVLSKNRNRLPPFLNLEIYEIGVKEVFVRYKILFTETTLIDTRARIREEAERYLAGFEIKSFDIKQLVNDITDRLQEFLLRDKYRKTVLTTEVEDIVCFNKSWGENPQSVRAEGLYVYKAIPIITI